MLPSEGKQKFEDGEQELKLQQAKVLKLPNRKFHGEVLD